MKLVAGFNSVEDYPLCVTAGADELFCGYIPAGWMERFGLQPMNRREVLFCNVQLGSESELRILGEMVKAYGVPVALTLNRPFFHPTTYPFLIDYIWRCIEIGFERFIIADPGLITALKRRDFSQEIEVQVSGEYGEMNPIVIRQLKKKGAKRVIFPRHFSFDEMKICVDECGECEYEAFLLNEKCHFHGAYCRSLHCDELPPLCRIPYRFKGRQTEPLDMSDELGASGCGLCSMYQLRDAGVTHLKIVGRGNYTERILRDISAAKQAIEILDQAETKHSFEKELKQRLFPKGCRGNCYYR